MDYYRTEYLKAAPYLNLMSRGEAFGRVDQNEVEKLRKQVAKLESERIKVSDLEAQLEALQRLVEEKLNKES